MDGYVLLMTFIWGFTNASRQLVLFEENEAGKWRMFKEWFYHTDDLRDVRFSAAGDHFAACSDDGGASVWSFSSVLESDAPVPIKDYAISKEPVFSIDLADDDVASSSYLLAYGSLDQRLGLQRIDCSSGSFLLDDKIDNSNGVDVGFPVWCVRIAKDASKVAACGASTSFVVCARYPSSLQLAKYCFRCTPSRQARNWRALPSCRLVRSAGT